jgi:hypothetical protein
MGMSTHVKGFKPPNDKWQKMAEAWRACRALGVEPPTEVTRFFDGEEPDGNGVEVGEQELKRVGALREWKSEYAEGFEVDVINLPTDVTVIRFYNNW